jgi:hypothetical protein
LPLDLLVLSSDLEVDGLTPRLKDRESLVVRPLLLLEVLSVPLLLRPRTDFFDDDADLESLPEAETLLLPGLALWIDLVRLGSVSP